MKISKLLSAALAAMAIGGALDARASTIDYSIRGITDSTFLSTNDYQLGWGQQSSTVSSNTLSTFTGHHPSDNSFMHLSIDFNVGSLTNAVFQFGLDAGRGGELRLDGNLLTRNTNDMWWASNWGNSAGILNTSSLVLNSGHHVLEGFWAEACCSGEQAGRFSIDNGANWQDLNVTNLNALAASAVPEPGMLALLGIGFAGLGLGRRKKEVSKTA